MTPSTNAIRKKLPHLLFLFLLPNILARQPNTLTTAPITCPCTFSITRSTLDNTPFTITTNPPNIPPQSNITNHHATYQTSNHAFFYTHIPYKSVVTLSIHSLSTNKFTIQSHTHTTCPTLLGPDPPELFRQSIVGGSPAAPSLQGFLAYLYNPFNGRACTGTIISSRWIITAAHCNISPNHIAYLTGDQARQGIPYRIGVVYPHFLFSDRINAQYDIALVKLVKPVTGAGFMKVSVNSRIPVPASAARVLGYGSVAFDSPNEGVLFGQLRQVDVPIVTHEACVRAYTVVNELNQVCAGYLGKGGCDSCQGDSGGPLIQYDDVGEAVLVGVVSRGVRCGEARFPGIYIRVGAFEEWLDSRVDQRFRKANSTRAVLAVTRSSRVTFRRLIIPVVAVCGGVLALGLVVLLFVKMRRRKGKSVDSGSIEDSASVGIDGATEETSSYPATRSGSVVK